MGTVAAQSSESVSVGREDQTGEMEVVAWCPVEVFTHLAAMDAPALRESATTESWPSVIPPVSAMRRSAAANVFASDPSSGGPIEVTLSGLVGDGLHLDGEYVRVGSDRLDGAGALAFSANGDFRYQPDTTKVTDCITDQSRCARFDAVNVYYHVDTFVRQFWIDKLSITPSFVAEARVHIAGDGAFADWATRSMKLRVGDIFMKNSALSDDIILHEYNHLLMASLGFEIGTGVSDQTRALHEAYADYFMASWTNDARVGEWVVTCPPRQQCTGPQNDTDLRTLILNPEEWNWRQGQPADTLKYGFCLRYHEGDLKCKASWNNNAKPYVWGMMWAASLWDLRTIVGAGVADVIAVEAVRMHTSITDFQSALEHIITSGTDRFGRDVGEQVQRAFEQRGFLLASDVGTESLFAAASQRRDIQVWPNPVRHKLNVRLDTEVPDADAPWVIHDVMGRVVMSGRTGIAHRWSVPAHDLPPGLYRLRVEVYPSSHSVLFNKMH